jgi:hypothetical protein
MGSRKHRLDRRTFTVAAGAATLAAGTGVRVAAQGATPVAAPGTVIAEGLWNPKFLAFADDGTLYVTESGVGGDEPFVFGGPPEATPITAEGTPAAGEPPATRGFTGQVSAIAPDGTVTVVASELASYSIGVGPSGITVQDGMVFFAIGGSAVLAGIEPLAGENTVNRLDPATGELTELAEFNTYEVENNPDGTDVNPNLYGLSSGDTDGRLTVNDAGSNTIFSVDPETGEFTLRGVVPDLNVLTEKLEGGGHTDDPARQPVPTGGAFNGGGVYHTALLSEAWPEDGPSVLKVDGDGLFATFTPVVSGLSMVTDVEVGPDGQLYFCQLFDSLDSGAPIGSVHRANTADGTHEPVAEGLVMPHGITFDGDGNLYVTTQVLMSAPGAPAGQVVRIDGIAVAS